MTEHRSFYLNSKQNDFAEFSEIDLSDIPFVDPANDNEPTHQSPAACRKSCFCQRPGPNAAARHSRSIF